jgi:hypothetical protein
MNTFPTNFIRRTMSCQEAICQSAGTTAQAAALGTQVAPGRERSGTGALWKRFHAGITWEDDPIRGEGEQCRSAAAR